MNTTKLGWACALVFCLSGFAGAAIPAGQNLPTQAQFDAKYLPYLKKAGSDAYRRSGQRDPKWDEAAIRFIDACDGIEAGPLAGTAEFDLARIGENLFSQGCNDPLVHYQYARLLQIIAPKNVLTPHYERAAAELAQFGYPAVRQALAWARIAGLHGADPRAEKAGAALVTLVPALAGDPALKHGRQLMVRVLSEIEHQLPPAQAKAFFDAIKATEGVDAVALDALEGMYHIKAAWQSRGGGWASDVTQEGWKGFGVELELARKSLTKSWQADPTIPEVCESMIGVGMGGGNPPEVRTWFERAVRARFDYWPAYEATLFTLYPRWGGSAEAMMALGRECRATGRFDTIVPYLYIQALRESTRDANGDLTAWSDAAVYPAAVDVLEKLASHPNHAAKAAMFRTQEAAIAARLGRWADSRKLLDALGDKIDAAGSGTFRFKTDELRGRVYAYTGPAAKLALGAQDQYGASKLEEAAKLYEQAAAMNQEIPAAAQFLHSAQRAVRWKIEFEAGRPVSLDRDLIGWEATDGQWSWEQGWIVAKTPNHEVRLTCMADFGHKWELSADMSFTRPDAPWMRGGVLIAQNYGWNWIDCDVCPGDKNIAVGPATGMKLSRPAAMDPGPALRLLVQRDGERVNMAINGRPVLVREAIPEYREAAVERIALGSDLAPPGAILRFRNIVVRRIDRLPMLAEAVRVKPPEVLLPPLGVITDEHLKELESAEPTQGPKQLELADAWWDYAQTLDGPAAQNALVRAGVWYDMAKGGVPNDEKERMEQRLAKISETAAWESIIDKAQHGTVKSGTVGGPGGGEYDEIPGSGAILVGFVVKAGNSSGHEIIHCVQPIFLGADGRFPGHWHKETAKKGMVIEAHKGYAVGGMVAKGGGLVDGFKLIFMRVKGDSLDANDAYESEWVGGKGGGELVLGNGRPVVGVYGKAGGNLDSLGLVQLQP
jgi:hypothetical protein